MKNDKKINEIELNFASIVNDISIPSLVDKKTSKGYINWGDDNKLPNYLYDNYLECSTLQAIVNQITDYVLGNGIETTYTSISKEELEEIIRKCVVDYLIFGGFTLECIKSKLGKVVSVSYQNIMNIRVDEELTTAFLSNKWGSWSGKDIVKLPLYKGNTSDNHFILYNRGHLTRGINPIPIYSGALKSVVTLNNVRDFHLNNLQNGFTAACIINLNNGNIKTRELQEIKSQLQEKYCGSKNAGKFILLNGGDKEHAATIERLNADNFGDQYYALQESSIEDIYVAFRINPMLVGVNVETGFSKEEFENAYALYYSTFVKPIQNMMIKEFKKIGIEITFKPVQINWAN